MYPGQEILYLFDFGDNWAFQITVLSITTDAPEPADYQVLKSVSEAPEQYPNSEW